MGHTHNQVENHQTAKNTVYFSILGSLGLVVVKGLAGFFGNSYALVADAIESTTDIFSSILVLIGLHYGSKPADENHPYGHGRIEPLVTFIVVGILIITATFIAIQSIKNIQTPHEGPKSWTLIVLGLIILWKEISYQLVKKRAKQLNSSSLMAEAWHHRSDAITSVAAFIGITIALIFGAGYETADDWAALFASAFILYNCYRIFRPALVEIMDENVYHDMIDQIRVIAKNVDGVLDTEKCYVRKLGLYYWVDIHTIVDESITVREGHDISHRLKDELMHELPEIKNVLVHIEPGTSKSLNKLIVQ